MLQLHEGHIYEYYWKGFEPLTPWSEGMTTFGSTKQEHLQSQ